MHKYCCDSVTQEFCFFFVTINTGFLLCFWQHTEDGDLGASMACSCSEKPRRLLPPITGTGHPLHPQLGLLEMEGFCWGFSCLLEQDLTMIFSQ